MEIVPISKVVQLSDGRLAVYPETSHGDYQYVYREAGAVYWDRTLKCFHSTVPREWTYKQWYSQIVSIVWSSLGVRLRLSPSSCFDGGEEFQDEILASDGEVQKWIDVTFPTQ